MDLVKTIEEQLRRWVKSPDEAVEKQIIEIILIAKI